MGHEQRTEFDSIESAQEYVALLADVVAEAAQRIASDVAFASDGTGSDRRIAALRLVDYKLGQLHDHLSVSRRILNDLRTLRRLLYAESPNETRVSEAAAGSVT